MPATTRRHRLLCQADQSAATHICRDATNSPRSLTRCWRRVLAVSICDRQVLMRRPLAWGAFLEHQAGMVLAAGATHLPYQHTLEGSVEAVAVASEQRHRPAVSTVAQVGTVGVVEAVAELTAQLHPQQHWLAREARGVSQFSGSLRGAAHEVRTYRK